LRWKAGIAAEEVPWRSLVQAMQQPDRPADSDPQQVAHKAVERAEVSNIRGDAEETQLSV